MSSEQSKKPKIEKIEIDRKWLESIVELDLCGPIKEKIGRETCKPDIVVKPCQPLEAQCYPICEPLTCFPVCWPGNKICWPDTYCWPKNCWPGASCDPICYPTFHPSCFPDRCSPDICYPIRHISKVPEVCGPSVELPADRLDEIAKVVKELKDEIVEIKKKIDRK